MTRKKGERRFAVLEMIRENPRISMEEICQATGLKSKSNAWRYVHELELEGLISKIPHQARGMYVGDRYSLGATTEKVLQVLNENPAAHTSELVQATGCSASNLWYHLHRIEKFGAHPRIIEIIERLQSENKFRQSENARKQNQKKTRKSRLSEAERILLVVEKAQQVVHDEADLHVLANGVKVITRKSLRTWTTLG